MKPLILLIIIVAAGIIGLSSALYVVDETEQVIILRFGEVQDIKRDPGLNIKAPFIDVVVRFDKRILRIDAPPVLLETGQVHSEKSSASISAAAASRASNVFQLW